MKRKRFLSGMIGASVIFSLEGLSSVVSGVLDDRANNRNDMEIAKFGVVHLRCTSLKNTIQFWTEVVGMQLRFQNNTRAEFGTSSKTLVSVIQSATMPNSANYSGMYHFAIHTTSELEFARMFNRLRYQGYPCSPTDHTMSKSVYLSDPNGITVEYTLETPERFKRVDTSRGLAVEDVDGKLRGAAEPLDVNAILELIPKGEGPQPISEQSYIGHIHLYSKNVEASNEFYQSLGFKEFNFLPSFKYADVGAGGAYQHRIAMNSWHGYDKLLLPEAHAGLDYYEIIFQSKDYFEKAVKVTNATSVDNVAILQDPTGINIQLSLLPGS